MYKTTYDFKIVTNGPFSTLYIQCDDKSGFNESRLFKV